MKRKTALCALLCAAVALTATSCALPETERFEINTSALTVYTPQSLIEKYPSAAIETYPSLTIAFNGGNTEVTDGRNAYKLIYSLKDILCITDPYSQLRYKGSTVSENTKSYEFHQYAGKTEIFNNSIIIVTENDNAVSVTCTFDSANPEAIDERKHTLTHCFDEACAYVRGEYGADVSSAFINNPQTGMYRTSDGYIAAYRFGVVTSGREYVCVVDANTGNTADCVEIIKQSNEKT